MRYVAIDKVIFQQKSQLRSDRRNESVEDIYYAVESAGRFSGEQHHADLHYVYKVEGDNRRNAFSQIFHFVHLIYAGTIKVKIRTRSSRTQYSVKKNLKNTNFPIHILVLRIASYYEKPCAGRFHPLVFHVPVFRNAGLLQKSRQAEKRCPLKVTGPARKTMVAKMVRRSRAHVDEAAELMRKVADGDVEAFTRLYYAFCPTLRRFFANYNNCHIPLDDFIQEVFTRLWQQRKNYRGSSCFLAYLMGIARHTLNEQIRKSRMIAPLHLKKQTHFPADSHNELSEPEAELSFKELIAALEGARASLTAKEREALELSQAVDVPFSKASLEPICSREALRSRLKRARKRSQRLLTRVLSGEQSSNQTLLGENKSQDR